MKISDLKNAWSPSIQGLRGLSILMVVTFHINPNVFPAWSLLGVSIFFTISGYVITGSLIRLLNSHGGSLSQKEFLKIFYTRRLRRLMPVSILVMTVTLVASWFDSSSNHRQYFESALFCLFYIGNFYGIGIQNYGLAPALAHFWTLSIEEQFYAFYPFLLFHFKQFGYSIKRIISTFLLIFLFVQLSHPLLSFTGIDFGIMPTTYADLFLAGAIWNLVEQSSFARNSKFLLLVRYVGFLLAMTSCLPHSVSKIDISNPLYMNYIALTAISIFFLAFTTKVFENWIFQFFGRISYSLYCIHWPLMVFARIFIGDGLAIMVFAAVVSTFLSDLSHKYFESRFYKASLGTKVGT